MNRPNDKWKFGHGGGGRIQEEKLLSDPQQEVRAQGDTPYLFWDVVGWMERESVMVIGKGLVAAGF